MEKALAGTALSQDHEVARADLPFEFMLNATRLEQKIANHLFTERTGLLFEQLKPLLIQAAEKGLLTINDQFWQITPLGRRYTNNLQALFLPD